jgi:hypothetical protein
VIVIIRKKKLVAMLQYAFLIGLTSKVDEEETAE